MGSATTSTSSVEKQPGGFKHFDAEVTDLLGGRPERPHFYYSKELHRKGNLDPVGIPVLGTMREEAAARRGASARGIAAGGTLVLTEEEDRAKILAMYESVKQVEATQETQL
jgi:hypothetical protein